MNKKILILNQLIVLMLNMFSPALSIASDASIVGGALLGGSLLLLEKEKQGRATEKTRLKVKEWREKQELLKQQQRSRQQNPPLINSPAREAPQVERDNPSLNKSEEGITLKAGTGVLLGELGYVLTSYHLLKGAKYSQVTFVNGEKIQASLFIKDGKNDLAFLKLDHYPDLPMINITMGDSSQMQIGDEVFTIGYPLSNILGHKPRYSEGVISSLSGMQDNRAMFQVSVPIQSGNSGGPLFNGDGELVGIVSSTLDPENTFRVLGTMPQNVNFAVKSSLVKNMILMSPESLLVPTGIIVVPTESSTLRNFKSRVQSNIVLIETEN